MVSLLLVPVVASAAGQDEAWNRDPIHYLQFRKYGRGRRVYTVVVIGLVFTWQKSSLIPTDDTDVQAERLLEHGRSWASFQMQELARGRLPPSYFEASAAAAAGKRNPSFGVLVFEGDPPRKTVGYLELALPGQDDGLLPFERRIGRKYSRPRLTAGSFPSLEIDERLRFSRAESGAEAPWRRGYVAELEKFARDPAVQDDVVPLLFGTLQDDARTSEIPLAYVARHEDYREYRPQAKDDHRLEVGIDQFYIHSLPLERLVEYYRRLGFSESLPGFEKLPPSPERVADPLGFDPRVLALDRERYVGIGEKMNRRKSRLTRRLDPDAIYPSGQIAAWEQARRLKLPPIGRKKVTRFR
jgi:hypothetical protein